jgi:hypothetical protein
LAARLRAERDRRAFLPNDPGKKILDKTPQKILNTLNPLGASGQKDQSSFPPIVAEGPNGGSLLFSCCQIPKRTTCDLVRGFLSEPLTSWQKFRERRFLKSGFKARLPFKRKNRAAI